MVGGDNGRPTRNEVIAVIVAILVAVVMIVVCINGMSSKPKGHQGFAPMMPTS